MRKTIGRWLTLLLCFLMSVNVWADAGRAQNIDYKTDYYMVAASTQGGVDIYSEPDYNSPKLNEELIPNGTAFHIQGEKKADDGRIWGFAQYQGMNGYLPLEGDFKPVTRSEAIDHEFYAYGGKAADYDLTVTAEDGNVLLYNGPGSKYGEVSGAPEIKKGTVLHITSEVDVKDGGLWGKTTTPEGYTGWVNVHTASKEIAQDLDMIQNPTLITPEGSQTVTGGEDASVDTQGSAGKAAPTATPTPKPTATPTPKPTATPTPKPTATPTPEPTATPTPEPTATPTPEPTATPTPEPTATPTEKPTATPTEEPTAMPTEEPTATPTEEPTAAPTEEPTEAPTAAEEPTQIEVEDVSSVPEATVTEEAEAEVTEIEDVSSEPEEGSEEAQEADADAAGYGWYKNPVIWVLAGAILIALLIVFFLLKQKKEDDK